MTEPYAAALQASYDAVLDELQAEADIGRGLTDLRARLGEQRAGTGADREHGDLAGRGAGPRAHDVPGDARALPDIRFLTVAEAAAMMRVSKMTVYRLVHSGELKAIRVGRSFRIPEQALQAYATEAWIRQCPGVNGCA